MIKQLEDRIRTITLENISKLKSKEKLFRILSCLLLIVIGVFGLVTENWWIFTSYFIGVALIIVSYIIFNKSLLNGVTKILTEELLPNKALEAFDKFYPQKDIIGKLNSVYALIIIGKFEKGKLVIEHLNIGSSIRKNQQFRDYYLYLQKLLYILTSKNIVEEELNDKDFSSQNLSNTIKAIADIESGKPNSYFDSAACQHKLDELIAIYYQARHNLLIGNKEKAFALFEQVSESNDEIYFVREAKRYLAKYN